jgi:hypothetical protein
VAKASGAELVALASMMSHLLWRPSVAAPIIQGDNKHRRAQSSERGPGRSESKDEGGSRTHVGVVAQDIASQRSSVERRPELPVVLSHRLEVVTVHSHKADSVHSHRAPRTQG